MEKMSFNVQQNQNLRFYIFMTQMEKIFGKLFKTTKLFCLWAENFQTLCNFVFDKVVKTAFYVSRGSFGNTFFEKNSNFSIFSGL